MAESFEAYHVPQQSRRDKLRLSNLHLQTMLPIYDPDYLALVKEEGGNFMGYNPSCSTTNLMYVDPRSSSFQDVEATPFIHNSQSVRLLDQSFYGGAVINSCGQGLSLSLSSHQSNLPMELNLQNYEHDSSIYSEKVGSLVHGVGCNEVCIENELSRSSVPLGPFTGYASILKRSRFLRPAQQLLEEICDVGKGIYVEKMSADAVLLDPMMENVGDDSQSCNLGSEQRKKKSRLMSMLDEVYKRYKQYYHQMQAVVASFESVAGVTNAAPFASMAFKAMSKHFRCLRKAISDQLQFLTEPYTHDISHEKDMAPGFESSSGTGILGFVQHQPVWRPQRGLPERAVAVLRAWLFDHFLHPYPTDTDKLMLAKQTGLSRNQVSNWFINARVRLWKPMVEEIHTLETRQSQKSNHKEAVHADRENDHVMPTTSSSIPVCSKKTSASKQRVQEISLKRTRKESVTDNATQRNYDNISNMHHHLGFGASSGGASGSVSLTLGLQQNNGNRRISDHFPLTAARRFGVLEPNGEGYVAGWLP